MSRSLNPAPAPKKQQQQQQNTSPPLRTGRLLVKRDGSELALSALQLRDALNKALGFTAVLSTQVSRGASGRNTGNVSISLMENLLTSKLYARVGEHLNTVPGAVSLHLDNPIVQVVVHGIPVDMPLELLQTELTTYNPGLSLASTPRWLTKPDQRKEKKSLICCDRLSWKQGTGGGSSPPPLCLLSHPPDRTQAPFRSLNPMCQMSTIWTPYHQMFLRRYLSLVRWFSPHWGTHLPNIHLFYKWSPLHSHSC